MPFTGEKAGQPIGDRVSADDQLAIHQLIARSAACSDFQHWEGFAEIYTEDAETHTDSHDCIVIPIDAYLFHAFASIISSAAITPLSVSLLHAGPTLLCRAVFLAAIGPQS